MQVLAAVWSFIQNQILGMKWLSSIVYSVLNVLGLDMNTRVGGMIHFSFMIWRKSFCFYQSLSL